MLKNYYLLTKPGIIYGNSIVAIGGFLLASNGQINFPLLLVCIIGFALVIGSACVFNNFLDRDIDKKMARTRIRALVTRSISIKNAITFGVVIGLIGFFILAKFTNPLTVLVAATGYFFYVIVYTFGKRVTTYGTELGSISGAIPPVVGYVAVTNNLDTGALLLFLILVFWQMPHFYSITIYRLKDYAEAKIPVFPVLKGIPATKLRMLIYLFFFVLASTLLSFYGYTGSTYLFVMLTLGLIWLGFGLTGLKTENDAKWARKMFRISLIIILTFSLLISVNAVLP